MAKHWNSWIYGGQIYSNQTLRESLPQVSLPTYLHNLPHLLVPKGFSVDDTNCRTVLHLFKNMYVCVCRHICTRVWECEGQRSWFSPSYFQVGSEDWIQINKLVVKYHYLLSHLASLELFLPSSFCLFETRSHKAQSGFELVSLSVYLSAGIAGMSHYTELFCFQFFKAKHLNFAL